MTLLTRTTLPALALAALMSAAQAPTDPGDPPPGGQHGTMAGMDQMRSGPMGMM